MDDRGDVRPRYRFGPLERRGLVAGWRGGQIAAVAGGLVVGILALHGRPSVRGVLVAVAAVGASVAFAWWPVGGRTGEQWAPTVVRWGAAGLTRGRRRRPGAAGAGHCLGADGAPCLVVAIAAGSGVPAATQRSSGARRPSPGPRSATAGAFANLRILGFRADGGAEPIGVLRDARPRTYTAAMAVLGHSFALLGSGEKERRVVSWASVLSSLARERSVLNRLQWIATTVPDDGAAVDGHLTRAGVLPPSSDARRSYTTLLRSAGAETCRHEVLVAVQVRAAGPGGRAIRSLGGDDRAACAVLWRELASLRRQLGSADMPVERVLDERALAAAIRQSTDPSPAAGRPCPPCGVEWPWPLAVDSEWACVRTDGTWHTTYWIAEWPRVDVGPEFLGPLLLGSVRRSVAVVMEPLSPTRAIRQAERGRTADIAEAELRRRGGFLATARRTKEAELASRREGELADGHASFRFSGYVTVTAATKEQLAAACDATEQAASQCRLELRRLFGDQERALTCTLPLGRGLV